MQLAYNLRLQLRYIIHTPWTTPSHAMHHPATSKNAMPLKRVRAKGSRKETKSGARGEEQMRKHSKRRDECGTRLGGGSGDRWGRSPGARSAPSHTTVLSVSPSVSCLAARASPSHTAHHSTPADAAEYLFIATALSKVGHLGCLLSHILGRPVETQSRRMAVQPLSPMLIRPFNSPPSRLAGAGHRHRLMQSRR